MKSLAVFLIVAIALVSTAPALQTNELITFGDFEGTNRSNVWMITNIPTNILGAGFYANSANSHTGTWYGYVGDFNASRSNACGTLYQYISVPTNNYWLDISFYLNISTAEATNRGWDTQTVIYCYLNNTNGIADSSVVARFTNMDKSPGTGAANYVRRAFTLFPRHDLGTNAALMFVGKTDTNNYTTFRIDDVSVKVVTPDPSPLTWTIVPAVSNGLGGAISPSSPVVVTNGDGRTITFTATPDNGYEVYAWYTNGHLDQWGGAVFGVGGTAITNMTISVLFTQIIYRLDVQINGGGTYTASPPGPYYPSGTQVQLTATPESGYIFNDWTGDCPVSDNPQLKFVMGQVSASLGAALYPQRAKSLLASDAHVNQLKINFCRDLGALPSELFRLAFAPSCPTVVIQSCSEWTTVVETSSDISNDEAWEPQATLAGRQYGEYNLPVAVRPFGFLRTRIRKTINIPPFMAFPIHANNMNWTNANVTAIMDHSPPDRTGGVNIDSKGIGGGRIGSCQGDNWMVTRTDPESTSLYDAGLSGADIATMSQFPFQYNLSGNQNAIAYDSHRGYDFGGVANMDVYPVWGGVTATDADFAETPQAGLASYMMKHLHAVIVLHKTGDNFNGFCSIYMHLSDVEDCYVTNKLSDGTNWQPQKGDVFVNKKLGVVGGYPNFKPHLHFEVWMKTTAEDGTVNWITIDPYGSYAKDGNIITPPLYKN